VGSESVHHMIRLELGRTVVESELGRRKTLQELGCSAAVRLRSLGCIHSEELGGSTSFRWYNFGCSSGPRIVVGTFVQAS